MSKTPVTSVALPLPGLPLSHYLRAQMHHASSTFSRLGFVRGTPLATPVAAGESHIAAGGMALRQPNRHLQRTHASHVPSRGLGAFSGPHISRRLGTETAERAAYCHPLQSATVSRCEVMVKPGGCGSVGYDLYTADPDARLGVLIAGSSGRPGGSVGSFSGELVADKVHAGHRTQEEDMVANWLSTQCRSLPEQKDLFRRTVGRRWGFAPHTRGHVTV